MRRGQSRHLLKTPNEPSIPDKFNEVMSNFGLTAVEAVGLTIPENLSNDPVTKAVYDNILGNIPTKKKVTVYCDICSLEFSSQVVLDTHLAGSKHQRKLKSKELMKNLEETESGFERNTVSGVIRCTVCDITVNSPQLLATHVAGNKHKSKRDNKAKRENGEEGGTPAKKVCSGATGQANGIKSDTKADGTDSAANAAAGPPKKKERPPLQINIPSCVTKLEDTKSGGKFLCNPCQAHCNSDVQLSQHLSSKKHLEKDNFSCSLCNLQFSSRTILSAHLAGSKHRVKVKGEDILKQLARTDPSCGRDRSTGELRCSLCNVGLKAPHVLQKHVLSREHRMNKGEDVSDEPEQPAETPLNGKSSFGPKIKKERKAVALTNIPSFVTQCESTYLCNLCEAHCNSETQLAQHLSCRKHMDKVSGKQRTPTAVPRWKGGLFGKGRGAASAYSGGGGGASGRWQDTSMSAGSGLLIGAVTSNFSQPTYADSSLSNYTDSYGLSSLGRNSISEYGVGKPLISARGGGGGGGGIGRGRPEMAAYGRTETFARPGDVYGRGAPAYAKPEAYARTAEYATDYHHGKATEYSAYSRQAAAYPTPGYGPSQGATHTTNRGGVYTYATPLSHSFVSGGKII